MVAIPPMFRAPYLPGEGSIAGRIAAASVLACLLAGLQSGSRASAYTLMVEDGATTTGFSATITTPAFVRRPSSEASVDIPAGAEGSGAASAGAVDEPRGAGEVTLAPGGALRVVSVDIPGEGDERRATTASGGRRSSDSPGATADVRAVLLVLGAPTAAAAGSTAGVSPFVARAFDGQVKAALVVEVWAVDSGDREGITNAERHEEDIAKNLASPRALSLVATCALTWGGASGMTWGAGLQAKVMDGNAVVDAVDQRCTVHAFVSEGDGDASLSATSKDNLVQVEIALPPTPSFPVDHQWRHDVRAIVVRESLKVSEVSIVLQRIALVSFTDLVDLSWAWLARAARCSSEMYGAVMSTCGIVNTWGSSTEVAVTVRTKYPCSNTRMYMYDSAYHSTSGQKALTRTQAREPLRTG